MRKLNSNQRPRPLVLSAVTEIGPPATFTLFEYRTTTIDELALQTRKLVERPEGGISQLVG